MVTYGASEPTTSMAGWLARTAWMLLGSAVVFFVGCYIAFGKTKTDSYSFSAWDIVFWSVVIVMAIVRYVDVRYLEGRTAAGAPATGKDFLRYVIYLAIVASVGWLAAHGSLCFRT